MRENEYMKMNKEDLSWLIPMIISAFLLPYMLIKFEVHKFYIIIIFWSLLWIPAIVSKVVRVITFLVIPVVEIVACIYCVVVVLPKRPAVGEDWIVNLIVAVIVQVVAMALPIIISKFKK